MDLINDVSTSLPPTNVQRPYESQLNVNSCEFNQVVKKVRQFFLDNDFIEVHAQNRLSILAACEDPFTVASFEYAGTRWPLPQTGQMWLEYEMLKNPTHPGYFCISTSYRQEPNPVPGRHDLIFPLFEFEMKGGMEDLIKLEMNLLKYLGYDENKFMRGKYEDVANEYGVVELEHEHETRLYDEKTPAFFLTDFPEHTSPFWNMKRNDNSDLSNKVDVIMSGQETIGSAEREVDRDIMLERFRTISDGKYKEKIVELFGETRTMEEMNDYLNFEFFPRSGGGIGMTRLIRSMKMEGLL
jgi:aspartyl/asparaginyl-tRNA synthetase